jgi:hypothetical protein
MELTILGQKCRIEIMIACVILGFVTAMLTVCNCHKPAPENGKKSASNKSGNFIQEGFTKLADLTKSANVDYQMGNDSKGSWTQKALGYASDMGYDTVLSQHANYKGTPVPLDNTMNFFKDNAFKPECCPSSYSSSTGCACTSVAQLNYLNQRGGNRTSDSEF